MNRENTWQIINKSTSRFDPKWIEEEETLLNWAENPNFEKQPLSQIEVKFVYVNSQESFDAKVENIVAGILHTSIQLKPHDRFSILHKSVLFDKINEAKTPNTLFDNDMCNKNKWLEKLYMFDSAAIYSIPNYNEQNDQFDLKVAFNPLNFSKDIAKIHCSLSVFHDLYEIVVIMREIKNTIGLKSIIKDGTKIAKTKKVRISDDLPKEYIFSKTKPVAGKRRTKKAHQ